VPPRWVRGQSVEPRNPHPESRIPDFPGDPGLPEYRIPDPGARVPGPGSKRLNHAGTIARALIRAPRARAPSVSNQDANIVPPAKRSSSRSSASGWVEHESRMRSGPRRSPSRPEALGRATCGRAISRHRHHQPASKRLSSGIARPALRSTTRSSGRTVAPPTLRSAEAGGPRDLHPRSAPAWSSTPIFPAARSRGVLDNVPGRGEAGRRQAGVRDDRQLAGVAADERLDRTSPT
jgi:hypothetical protein